MDQYQEVLEIRTATVRLVSHLAQLPSSAIHFKDVLLSLPTTHRQQLQVRGLYQLKFLVGLSILHAKI